MAYKETQPFIPTDEVSKTVFDYYSEALRQNPDWLHEEVMKRWDVLEPSVRHAFEVFHAALFPDDLPEQQQAARRTLLAPYIEEQVQLTETLNSQIA